MPLAFSLSAHRPWAISCICCPPFGYRPHVPDAEIDWVAEERSPRSPPGTPRERGHQGRPPSLAQGMVVGPGAGRAQGAARATARQEIRHRAGHAGSAQVRLAGAPGARRAPWPGLALRARAAGVPVLQRPPQGRVLATGGDPPAQAGGADLRLPICRAAGLRFAIFAQAAAPGDTVHDVPSEGSTYPTCPSCTIWTWTGLCRGHAVRQPGRQALARGRLARGVPPPARRRLHPEAAGGNEQEAERASAGRRHGRRRGLAAHEPHGRARLWPDPASWWPGQRPDASFRRAGPPTIGIYRASTPVRTPLVGSNYTASLAIAALRPRARRSWPRSSRRWPPNDMNRGVYTLALRAASPWSGSGWLTGRVAPAGSGRFSPPNVSAVARRRPRSPRRLGACRQPGRDARRAALLQALLDRGLPVLLTHITATDGRKASACSPTPSRAASCARPGCPTTFPAPPAVSWRAGGRAAAC